MIYSNHSQGNGGLRPMGRIKKRFRAFTLLELIVVIAIITVLTAIAVPSLLTRLRNSRIQAANDQAQSLYMATQDYLISLQRKGISSDKLTSEGYFLPITDKDYAYLDLDGTTYHNGLGSGTTDNMYRSIVGILSRAGKTSTGGTWQEALENNSDSYLIVVYPKTFTVATVYFCEGVKSGAVCMSKYNKEVRASNAVTAAYNDPFESVYGAGNSQEYAVIDKSNKAYVGQYPIPGHKVT